jgi:hypothetical protein
MKITKEQLTNIIKEEVEKALEERMSHQEYTDWADKNGIKLRKVQDKDDNLLLVPVSKPKLPKNWRTLSVTDPNRYWFRMWYKHNKKPDAAIAPAKAQATNKSKGRKIPDLKVPAYDPSKDPDAGNYEKELDGLGGKEKGIDSFRFRDRSKPFDALGARKPRGRLKYSDLNPFKDLKLKGKPILINKAGKRTSLKAKDSQWKFRDGTIIPIYNYIPGRGRVEDEKGLKYYGLSLEEQVADFPSFADWWQGDNRKKYPTPSRAKRGYSIARSRAVSQTQKNLQKAADDLKDDQ